MAVKVLLVPSTTSENEAGSSRIGAAHNLSIEQLTHSHTGIGGVGIFLVMDVVSENESRMNASQAFGSQTARKE
jgi:hypothetical protein